MPRKKRKLSSTTVHKDNKKKKKTPTSKPKSPEKNDSEKASGGGDLSLSINETNKLRAKLGLKPLTSSSESSSRPVRPVRTTRSSASSSAAVVAINKAKHQREGRTASHSSSVINTGNEDKKDKEEQQSSLSSLSTAEWVVKQRSMAKERSKKMQEMDEEEQADAVAMSHKVKDSSTFYSSADLAGFKVRHDTEEFQEGESVVLTLKDKNVLNEEDEDELENVDLVTQEKNLYNLELAKKMKKRGKMENDSTSTILSKYDEDGNPPEKIGLRLVEDGGIKTELSSDEIRRKLHEQGNGDQYDLTTSSLFQNEYFTPEEMQMKFPKRKTSARRKKKAHRRKKKEIEDEEEVKVEIVLENESIGKQDIDHGSRSKRGEASITAKKRTANQAIEQEKRRKFDKALKKAENAMKKEQPITQETKVRRSSRIAAKEQIKMEDKEEDDDEEEEEEVDSTFILSTELLDTLQEEDLELQSSLERARRVATHKQQRQQNETGAQLIASRIRNLKKVSSGEGNKEDDDEGEVLNLTTEFCRGLSAIPMTKSDFTIHDDDVVIEEESSEKKDDEAISSYDIAVNNESNINSVNVDITKAKENDKISSSYPILPPESQSSSYQLGSRGLAGALMYVMKQGYLKTDDTEISSNSQQDTKRRTKDSEKRKFNLSNLENRTDAKGHAITQKESFREMSRKFHGKYPGKKKQEKHMKRIEEESTRLRMTDDDTPLNMVEKFYDVTKKTGQAYVEWTPKAISFSTKNTIPTKIKLQKK